MHVPSPASPPRVHPATVTTTHFHGHLDYACETVAILGILPIGSVCVLQGESTALDEGVDYFV